MVEFKIQLRYGKNDYSNINIRIDNIDTMIMKQKL